MADRAGMIPFVIENNEIYFLFMKPSDPAYGGDKFQIAKGGIEANETPEKAAIREGKEELGVKLNNVEKVYRMFITKVSGMLATYDMHIYTAKLKNRNLDKHDFETGEVKWLTVDEFKRIGKNSNKLIIEKVYEMLTNEMSLL